MSADKPEITQMTECKGFPVTYARILRIEMTMCPYLQICKICIICG